jgi:hypothetical protein
VNYRVEIEQARSRRDRAVERARGDFRRTRRALTQARDNEISLLRAQGRSIDAIAAEVGCSRALVFELVNPVRRERYNRRRREHMRLLQGRAA